MPRIRLKSLEKMMEEDGYNPQSSDSGMDLCAALETLSSRERIAIQTRFLGESRANFNEVAQRLKTNRNEASRLVYNALAKLREVLS